MISAFGVSAPGSGEAANSWSALNSYGAVVAGGGGHEEDSESFPKAYVNLIAVDKKYNFLDGAWDQISGGLQEGATPTAHNEMYQEYVAREEGWVYVFVSNENPTLVEVYFDDVTVTITPGNVIQGNEYYPYGLQTATSWTRESNVGNNFLYNGGTELNQTTQVYDLYYRNYDPVLGRFGQVDPKASSHGPVSPYHFGLNNPARFNDPMGDDEYDSFMRYNVMNGPYVASGRGESAYRDMDPYGRYTTARIMAQSIEKMGMMRDAQDSEITIADGIHTFIFGANGKVNYSYTSDEEFNSLRVNRKLDDLRAMFSGGSITSNYEGGPRLWQAWDGGFVHLKNGVAYVPGTNRRYYGIALETQRNQLRAQGKSKDPYDGHSFSIGGNLALGGGVNFGIGVVWNKAGDWKIYSSGGPSFGVDASIGVAVKSITNNKSEPFDPNQYGGWGSSHNVGIGVWDIVPIGGDNSPNLSTGTLGATYTESGGGVSFGLPGAYTYQTTFTSFLSNWFK